MAIHFVTKLIGGTLDPATVLTGLYRAGETGVDHGWGTLTFGQLGSVRMSLKTGCSRRIGPTEHGLQRTFLLKCLSEIEYPGLERGVHV